MEENLRVMIKDLAKEEHKYNHRIVDEASFRLGFEVGADEIISNPEKYGLTELKEDK